MINWGKVPLSSVQPCMFDSFDGGTGASITLTGLALGDILVYKGTSMTQRSSTSGFVLLDTDGIDIDTITGIHGFSIDTGDNTDAGFFVAGSFYTVVVASVTIDAQIVNFVVGTFWLGPTLTVAGVDEVDVTHVAGTAQTAGDLAALITTIDTVADVIAVDVAGLDGAAMRGTDGAALASICTEARLAILSGALTESYATDGATATLSQLLYMLLSALTQFSISGTTITCKKLDGITTSMTFTLDDGTNPTLRDRPT